MAEPILIMKYEFFSWRGFIVGAISIGLAFLFQSLISFPEVWSISGGEYALLIIVSGVVVGAASGSVLVFLFPPDQDVIGVSGLGSDNAAQHLSLILVLLSLVVPVLSGFLFFFEYFGEDPLILIWVIVGFLAPSLGLTVSMFDRTNAISEDLISYFKNHENLDLTSLEWLISVGPRTSTYRMGMLESAVRRVDGICFRGHVIVRDPTEYQIADH